MVLVSDVLLVFVVEPLERLLVLALGWVGGTAGWLPALVVVDQASLRCILQNHAAIHNEAVCPQSFAKTFFLRGRGFNNQFHIWHFAGAWIQKSVSHWVFCGGVDSKISFTFGILPGR